MLRSHGTIQRNTCGSQKIIALDASPPVQTEAHREKCPADRDPQLDVDLVRLGVIRAGDFHAQHVEHESYAEQRPAGGLDLHE